LGTEDQKLLRLANLIGEREYNLCETYAVELVEYVTHRL